ncbi:unnamed protein product, partial [Polarella glacialis]
FPAGGHETLYRNSRTEVRRFLVEKHPDTHRVYNLCSEPERRYGDDEFFEVSQDVVFPDHNPCPMQELCGLVEDQHRFLAACDQNVAA